MELKKTLIVILFILANTVGLVNAETDNLATIIEKYQATSIPKSMKAQIKLVVTKPSQPVRESVVELYSRGKEDFVLRFIAPERQRGTGYLKTGPDFWMILPNMTKPSKVSGKSMLNRTDLSFTYFTWLGSNKDYTPELAGIQIIDGVPHYVIIMKSTNNATMFASAKIWIRKKDYAGKKLEFYGKSERLLLTVSNNDFKDYGGLLLPQVTTVENAVLKGEKTEIYILQASINADLPANIFTTAYLLQK